MMSARMREFTDGRLLPAAILIFFVAAGARADDWLQYNGNAGDRASAEAIGEIEWSGAAPPALFWEIATPNGFSSFSVADGKAFTLASWVHTDSVLREFCVGLNAATGAALWASPMARASYDSGGSAGGGGDGPRSTPTCDGERVYVLDSRLNLYCFDAETGGTLWSKDIVSDYGGRLISWQNAASPLLEGELVVMGGGGAGRSFLAFNRTDGALVWQTDADEWMTHASPVAATIHGVRQIVFHARNRLVAVSAASGEELWRYAVGYNTSAGASPVVCGQYVYHSAGYGVGAGVCRIDWDGANFSAVQVWRKGGDLENQWSTPLYYNGHLYGLYGHDSYGTAALKCVDLLTGNEAWSMPGYGMGGLMRVDDKLVVLADDGDIAVVEAAPAAYTEIARADLLDGKCWSTPVLSDNRIYARSTTEGICFELSDLPTSTTSAEFIHDQYK